jgi:hypothetical protein
VAAGNPGEALIQAAEQLCARLGYPDAKETPPDLMAPGAVARRSLADFVHEDDVRLVADLRGSLARVAMAVAAGRVEGLPREVGAALDGAELVMLGELVQGNQTRLLDLMPSFVFLVTLPIVEQDEAIELSRQASTFLERARQDSNA